IGKPKSPRATARNGYRKNRQSPLEDRNCAGPIALPPDGFAQATDALAWTSKTANAPSPTRSPPYPRPARHPDSTNTPKANRCSANPDCWQADRQDETATSAK